MPDVVFESENLLARPWSLDDAESALLIYGDPEVMQHLGSEPHTSLDQQRDALRRLIDRIADFPDGLGGWALVRKSDQVLVGQILLKLLPETTKVEVGWHLGRDFWGHGYATEGGRAAIRHGFDTQRLEVIYAVVAPTNQASIRVTERLNMVPIGTTDEYYDQLLNLYKIERE